MSIKKSKRSPHWTQQELTKLTQLVRDGYTTRSIYREMTKYHPHRASGTNPRARRTWVAIRKMIDSIAKNAVAERYQGMSTIPTVAKIAKVSHHTVAKALDRYTVETVAHLRSTATAGRVGEANPIRYVNTEEAIDAVSRYLAESDSEFIGAKAYVCRFILSDERASSLLVCRMMRAMLKAAKKAGFDVRQVGKTKKSGGATKAHLTAEQWDSVRQSGEEIFRHTESNRLKREKALESILNRGVSNSVGLRAFLAEHSPEDARALRASAAKAAAAERRKEKRARLGQARAA